MRICVLGNAQSVHTQRWVRAYAERGHDVDLLSIRSERLDGVMVHTVSVGPSNATSPVQVFLSYARLLIAAPLILRRLKPDVVHAHYSVTHGVIAAVSRYRPCVLSVWGKDVVFTRTGLKGTLLRVLNLIALRAADRVTSTSDFMIPYVKHLAGGSVHAIRVPFGVDTQQFHSAARPAEAGLTIGFVKHLKRKYGPEHLVRAIAEIRPFIPDLSVVIAGDGELRGPLERLAQELGVADIVSFPGRVPHEDVPALMRSFDIFVNPSVDPSESFGVAILEASASGIPVIATRIGGIPEVALDGKTALLIEPEDHVDLARALLLLAGDPALRKSLGEAGRKFVTEHYEWQDHVDSMIDVLAAVADP